MITIGNPQITSENDSPVTTISYPIHEEGRTPRALFFRVDSRYQSFLNLTHADGVLIALLPWISLNGGRVRILPALSPKLCHFGVRLLSHILTGSSPRHSSIEIIDTVRTEKLSVLSGNSIGTGGSLGVDSLCVIKEMADAGSPITHLFHNNCGSHWGDDKLKEGRRELSRKFAESNGMEFVWMDSSLAEFYSDDGYINYFLFLDAGSVLILNGLFSEFRFGSSFYINHPQFGLKPPIDWGEMHLQAYILAGADTENTRFLIHGMDLTRSEKTAVLVDFPAAHTALNVCLFDIENCGDCLKCRRTISQLFLLGELDTFSQAFDLTTFHKEGHVRYLTYSIIHGGPYQEDMLRQVRSTNSLSIQEKRRLKFRCVLRQPGLLIKRFS